MSFVSLKNTIDAGPRQPLAHEESAFSRFWWLGCPSEVVLARLLLSPPGLRCNIGPPRAAWPTPAQFLKTRILSGWLYSRISFRSGRPEPLGQSRAEPASVGSLRRSLLRSCCGSLSPYSAPVRVSCRCVHFFKPKLCVSF